MSDNSWLGGYVQFLAERYPDIIAASAEHIGISVVAVALGAIVAIPAGILLANSRSSALKSLSFGIANLFQTIPSLALLALLIPLLGVGMKPAIFALFLYTLLPLLRNTYAGMGAADRSVLEAASGMGYSRLQTIVRIQLPLALPFILSGIRMTTVYVVSWTTLASLIGGGGLGVMIFSGLGVNKDQLIFTGAAAAIILALAADFLLSLLEKALASRKRQSSGAASSTTL